MNILVPQCVNLTLDHKISCMQECSDNTGILPFIQLQFKHYNYVDNCVRDN